MLPHPFHGLWWACRYYQHHVPCWACGGDHAGHHAKYDGCGSAGLAPFCSSSSSRCPDLSPARQKCTLRTSLALLTLPGPAFVREGGQSCACQRGSGNFSHSVLVLAMFFHQTQKWSRLCASHRKWTRKSGYELFVSLRPATETVLPMLSAAHHTWPQISRLVFVACNLKAAKKNLIEYVACPLTETASGAAPALRRPARPRNAAHPPLSIP